MEAIDLLITTRWLLPIAPKNTVLDNHAIAIRDGRIVDLLPTIDAKKHYQAEYNIALDNHALMPGLVNAHAHTPMNLFRGLADDLNLMDWLQKHIWPAEADIINETSVAIGSELAIAEMLRGGTTCFSDHYMFPQVTAEVVKKTGIRACLGLQMMDVPTKWAENGAEALQKGLAIYQDSKPDPLVTWAWAPHAPYTTTDETFKKLFDINQETKLPIHIHLHETKHEIDESMKQYGKRPLQRLQDLGLLSPDLIAVHMTQLNDDDIRLLKDAGAHVVHCPESNLKLASGFVPIEKLINAGINIAIGTDGAASNNDLDMFGELQTAALLAKAQCGNPTCLPADQALAMATINGAKALNLENEIGSLEKGKAADLIAVDLSPYITQPVYNPISALVYAINCLQVSHVWVAGKPLLENGELTQMDTDALLTAVEPWVKKAIQYSRN